MLDLVVSTVVMVVTEQKARLVRQGIAGERGLPGVKGDAGPRGVNGRDGRDGAKGATGAQGVAGTWAATGIQVLLAHVENVDTMVVTVRKERPGTKAVLVKTGQAKGTRGERGLPGADGEQGVAGALHCWCSVDCLVSKGDAGPRGVNGRDGRDGAKGATGAQGVAGAWFA